MKKSEARNLIGKVIERTFDPAPDGVEIILSAWEEAGVQWEPELPDRVAHVGDLYLVPENDRDRSVMEDEPKIYAEAAARYNAVERFISMNRFRGDLAGESLHNILLEERERLQ